MNHDVDVEVMPAPEWSAKRKRQYEHIEDGLAEQS
jgi:hypothetical protein